MSWKKLMQSESRADDLLLSRRRFLQVSGGLAAGLLVAPAHAAVDRSGHRELSLHNLHTGERITRTYWADGEYLADPLSDLNHVLRDHRTDEVHPIDPQLLDVLHRLRHNVGSRKPFEIISGYRSPKTNAMLRGKSNGVAKRSLHMQGKAIDVRLPGHQLMQLAPALSPCQCVLQRIEFDELVHVAPTAMFAVVDAPVVCFELSDLLTRQGAGCSRFDIELWQYRRSW